MYDTDKIAFVVFFVFVTAAALSYFNQGKFFSKFQPNDENNDILYEPTPIEIIINNQK